MWGTGYVVLPAAGLYEPIWEYDKGTLAKGRQRALGIRLTTAAVFRLLSARPGTRVRTDHASVQTPPHM